MNYALIYQQIIERAKNRILDGYVEKHHIIPKCLGGSNDYENIVVLTAREHYLCHRLLCEIYPFENKLVFAYWMLCKATSKNQSRNIRISAREYERLRLEYSRVLKERIPWNRGLTKDDPRVAKYALCKKWNSGLKKGDSTILDQLHMNSGKKRKGIKFTEERKKKISQSLKGRIFTEETKKKLSESHKNNNSSKYWKNHQCPNCGLVGRGPNMTRYHFDNCSKINLENS